MWVFILDLRFLFVQVIDWLENSNAEVVTIIQLCEKIQEYAGEHESYSRIYMKNLLKEHYKDYAVISDDNTGHGNSTTVTLLWSANLIISNFYAQQRKQSDADEKSRIIKTAAQLIMKDIKKCTKYFRRISHH